MVHANEHAIQKLFLSNFQSYMNNLPLVEKHFLCRALQTHSKYIYNACRFHSHLAQPFHIPLYNSQHGENVYETPISDG